MRALLLTILLLFSVTASAAVTSQTGLNSRGQPIIRFHNATPYYVNCYYQDQYNVYTFSIAPWSYSLWYMSYGPYKWQCK